MYITATSDSKDDTGTMVVAQWSRLDIDKSKISPRISSIPFMINVTKGGFIEERESFLWYVISVLSKIEDVGRGFYSIEKLMNGYENHPIYEYLVPYNKKYRYKELVEWINQDDVFYNILRYDFMEYITGIYSLQANIINDYKQKIYEELMLVVNPSDKSIDELSEEVKSDNTDNANDIFDDKEFSDNE